MSEKFLCLIATFDEETSKQMNDIQRIICEAGIIGSQTSDVPYHITLGYFDTGCEEETKGLLKEVCARTKSFDLSFSHIGLFGLKVLFLAPDINYELLKLHKEFSRVNIENSQGWTGHATLLIDEAENIQRALPLVAQNFQHINGRVESVSLYEFFPTRFIAQCKLL